MKKLFALLICLFLCVVCMGMIACDDTQEPNGGEKGTTPEETTVTTDPPHVHTPEEAVEENKIDATCTATGSFDEVIYCEDCDEEVSRTTKTIEKKKHTPEEAVEENKVDATCTATGSFDEVIYCEDCDEEVSRTTKTIEKKKHTYTPNVVEPTKFEQGYTIYTCSCNDTYKDDYVPATGSVGLTYSVNADGKTCSIWGMGKCTDTEIYIAESIDGYIVTGITYLKSSSITSIHIPDGVTSIGDLAFYGCSSLTSIHIPNTVTSIGEQAFSGCSSLKSINIPNGVTIIEDELFQDCTSLETVKLPNSITKIGAGAFVNCTNLWMIDIPDNVTRIEGAAFWNCSNLLKITIPESLTAIGGSAFRKCNRLRYVYYDGTAEEWNSKLTISGGENEALTSAVRRYYSEKRPTDSNYLYWHYVNGEPTSW